MMVRAKRLKPVHLAAQDAERRSAARIYRPRAGSRGGAPRQDLEQYLVEYRNTFRAKASAAWMHGAAPYQIFIAKLNRSPLPRSAP